MDSFKTLALKLFGARGRKQESKRVVSPGRAHSTLQNNAERTKPRKRLRTKQLVPVPDKTGKSRTGGQPAQIISASTDDDSDEYFDGSDEAVSGAESEKSQQDVPRSLRVSFARPGTTVPQHLMRDLEYVQPMTIVNFDLEYCCLLLRALSWTQERDVKFADKRPNLATVICASATRRNAHKDECRFRVCLTRKPENRTSIGKCELQHSCVGSGRRRQVQIKALLPFSKTLTHFRPTGKGGTLSAWCSTAHTAYVNLDIRQLKAMVASEVGVELKTTQALCYVKSRNGSTIAQQLAEFRLLPSYLFGLQRSDPSGTYWFKTADDDEGFMGRCKDKSYEAWQSQLKDKEPVFSSFYVCSGAAKAWFNEQPSISVFTLDGAHAVGVLQVSTFIVDKCWRLTVCSVPNPSECWH